MKKHYLLILVCLILPLGVNGCISKVGNSKGVDKPVATLSIVQVIGLKEQEIFNKIESTGRIKAKYTTELVARVDGFLQKRYFNEGSMVKKGDLLFLIEPNKYQIEANEARAEINKTKASLNEAEKNLARASELVKKEYISKSEYDKVLAVRDSAKASLEVNRAALSRANLYHSYTRIYSPINGKIGQINITEGNFVSSSSGSLAKIVSTDPVFVDFNIRER